MAQKSSSSLLAALLLIVAIIVAIFIWQPTNENLKLLDEQLANTLFERDSIQAEVDELVALEAQLPVAETERTRILAAVPFDINQDELIDDLDGIAKSVGVDLNSISFSLQDGQSGAKVASIVCGFTGPYEDLIVLLEALEGNDRLFRVASVGVQLGELSEEGVQQMTFSVTVEAYYQ